MAASGHCHEITYSFFTKKIRWDNSWKRTNLRRICMSHKKLKLTRVRTSRWPYNHYYVENDTSYTHNVFLHNTCIWKLAHAQHGLWSALTTLIAVSPYLHTYALLSINPDEPALPGCMLVQRPFARPIGRAAGWQVSLSPDSYYQWDVLNKQWNIESKSIHIINRSRCV